MTKSEFKRLKKQLDKIIQKAEDEALSDGVNISSPQFQDILKRLKEGLLERSGFTLLDYEMAELEFEAEEKRIKEQEKEEQKDLLERIPIGPQGKKGEKGQLTDGLKRFYSTRSVESRTEISPAHKRHRRQYE